MSKSSPVLSLGLKGNEQILKQLVENGQRMEIV